MTTDILKKNEKRIQDLTTYLEDIVEYFIFKLHDPNSFSCPEDLNKKEVSVIEVIGKKEPCTMSEVAEGVNLAVSTLTGIIDTLVEKKYVLRERSQKDRRIVNVRLSENGQKVYQSHHNTHVMMSKSILSYLENEEQIEFIRLFKKISDNLPK
jgi:DNA-binding MarR family transcriptional regulator